MFELLKCDWMQLSMIGLSAHSIPRLASGNEFCVTDAKAPRLQGPNSNIYIYIHLHLVNKQVIGTSFPKWNNQYMMTLTWKLKIWKTHH